MNNLDEKINSYCSLSTKQGSLVAKSELQQAIRELVVMLLDCRLQRNNLYNTLFDAADTPGSLAKWVGSDDADLLSSIRRKDNGES